MGLDFEAQGAARWAFDGKLKRVVFISGSGLAWERFVEVGVCCWLER